MACGARRTGWLSSTTTCHSPRMRWARPLKRVFYMDVER